MSDVIFGDKKTLTLSELLGGLCEAWGRKDEMVMRILINSPSGYTKNYLGSTVCSLSRTYENILEVIRMAYLYGDQSVNSYIGRVVSEAVKALLNPVISQAKANIIAAYNALPFAETLDRIVHDVEGITARAAQEVMDFIYFSRSRTNPYVDSTVAWLISEGSRALEEAQKSQQNPGGITGLSNPASGSGGQGANPIPPEKLAMIMASSSPRVLQQLQAIGEQQEALRSSLVNYEAGLAQAGKKAKEEALEAANAVGAPTNPDIAQEHVRQSKQTVDERSLLIQLIEVNHVIASEQIRQEKRLEALMAAMVEQAAITNQALTHGVKEEVEAQLKALEEVKQQILDASLGYASEISQASAVMDGVVNLIGSLGVERAGMILTEEEFQRLTQGGTISAP
ncbi:hypothetical protein [Thermus sp.]|uniref:hypothetical protein n=1 Tax=Thermus sp. TaxID=275 RepID=UPI0026158044|nr:hypothetical protein [Thermus sp.]